MWSRTKILAVYKYKDHIFLMGLNGSKVFPIWFYLLFMKRDTSGWILSPFVTTKLAKVNEMEFNTT